MSEITASTILAAAASAPEIKTIPAAKAPIKRAPRKTATTPKTVVAKTADPLTSAAAPTLIGANGELIRDTRGYTVDLLAPGEENEKRDFAKLLDKAPNDTHEEFVAWFAAKSGYTMDLKTVQLALATYTEFQGSPEHKAKTIAKRQEAAAKRGAAEAKKLERLQKAAAELKVMEAKKAAEAKKVTVKA